MKAQKASADTQLGQLRSRNEALTADLAELKGVQERVAALEGGAAAREQKLSQSEQKIADLTNALIQEKKGQELLSSQLSTKADLVAEFQQKLQTSQANQYELEKTIEKSRKEIAALQVQLRELKAQQAPAEPVPVSVDVKPKSTSKSEASAEQGESLSPSDLIDSILKRKAK